MTVSVRDASIADYAVFARLFPELLVPDPLPSAEQFAQQILPRAVIAEDGGAPAGYAHYRFYGRRVHVVHVITDPGARGRGVGRALLEAVRERAVRAGSVDWYLNVKRDNGAAIRLYERAGFVAESESWALRAEWANLLALDGSSSAVAVVAPPADDARLAERFGADAERIAFSRGRAGTVVVAVSNGSEPPGAFGVFDPAFPGVYPIGVAHLDLCRPLFAALHAHARHDYVNVSVERDRALADHLRAAARATLHFEIVRMGSPLA
jgi:ribosomal-protein-alanine N-acetyltransferase